MNTDDHIPTFNDLKFERHPSGTGFMARHTFPNNYSISVVCGEFFYSSPRVDLPRGHDYESFEIAVLDPEGEFSTRDFSHDVQYQDDVAGWQTQDDISDLMTRIFLKDKLDRML
jgi:hypothetical protein